MLIFSFRVFRSRLTRFPQWEEEEAWEEGAEEEGGYPQAQAIGDWPAANEGDLGLTTGEIVEVWDNQSDPTGWWQCAATDGSGRRCVLFTHSRIAGGTDVLLSLVDIARATICNFCSQLVKLLRFFQWSGPTERSTLGWRLLC